MQLVGAENWFIRWPFIFEGIIQGLSGSILALICLCALYPVIYNKIQYDTPFIPLLSINEVAFKLTVLIIAFSVILGAVGSFLSLNRFLTEE